MEKRHIGFELTILDSESELSPEELLLIKEAEKARAKAYAPYSRFSVGAAVMMETGEIIMGNNQENASYPSGLCAERVAIFQAGAQHPKKTIKSIAICASSKDTQLMTPAAPCGNCRQSIAEYEQRQKSPITILFRGESGPIYKCGSIADLLPLAFDSTFLGNS
ncbi:cytidine deaminase [Flagellimonas lutaonensis]|uniref:Cytidine deaminase n=1 Tax=Flagellimonas lutaonensis TaxID=516051 RepID=A0A0D5YQ94_9FLAO|nr:cytidine deaminase [Allomuricauda lutaonensis]AKA34485.1 Cytidine deaminase [Allomuricauda lutaonensis]